jgi:hypothetical protein
MTKVDETALKIFCALLPKLRERATSATCNEEKEIRELTKEAYQLANIFIAEATKG